MQVRVLPLASNPTERRIKVLFVFTRTLDYPLIDLSVGLDVSSNSKLRGFSAPVVQYWLLEKPVARGRLYAVG